MHAFQPMSESEAEIMRLFWDAGHPLTSAQVIELLQTTKSWKPSTVWTFLGRLADKGLLFAEKQGKRSLYRPALSEQDYRSAQTRQFLNSVHGGSVKSFFAALGGDEELDKDELDELRHWLLQGEGGEDV